jgi:uroporphyrinogen-III synthase
MLDGRRIAVPESRELDLFTRMLERQGAVVVRCPLVSIHDVEDSAPVDAWLDRLVQGLHDIVILYTGEGLSRLLGFARRKGIEADVIVALRKTLKIARGPKPAKVLRGVGLVPDVMAEEPTTAGLMKTLSTLPSGESASAFCSIQTARRPCRPFLKRQGRRSIPS